MQDLNCLCRLKESLSDQTCAEPNKICLMGVLPKLKVGRKRKCNHLLVSSEPIGPDDIWEEVPEGALVALDNILNAAFMVHRVPFRSPV